jgi:sentrin-specific protease 1
MATRTGEIIKKFRIPIEYKSLSRLSDRGWLDDELINFYMELLMERQVKNAEMADKDPNVYRLPKIHAFNTFFYPKLLKGYNTVCRWTKKVLDIDLLL